MREIRTSGLMSGEGKRGVAERPKLPRPSSTLPRLSLHQAALSADPFPEPLLAAQAKILASETANTVTNQSLQLFGARGYSRDYPLERAVRDARMFTIAGGTAQVLRTLVASRVLDTKLPQTRGGYVEAMLAPSLAAK